jgi:hypothetical protein
MIGTEIRASCAGRRRVFASDGYRGIGFIDAAASRSRAAAGFAALSLRRSTEPMPGEEPEKKSLRREPEAQSPRKSDQYFETVEVAQKLDVPKVPRRLSSAALACTMP